MKEGPLRPAPGNMMPQRLQLLAREGAGRVKGALLNPVLRLQKTRNINCLDFIKPKDKLRPIQRSGSLPGRYPPLC